MMAPVDPARLPPSDLDGLDPSWSRLIEVPLDGGIRTFHVLDTHGSNDEFDLTVLCVHGNPSWSYLWRHVLASLPPGVRGIAVDHLDMGFSEQTGTVRRLGDRIDDLCELTDAMGLTGPVVTLAHDWGGPISLGWAQRHLPQLQSVILTNTAVHQPEGAAAPRVIRMARTRSALHRATVDTTAFITGAFEMSHPRTPKQIRAGFLAPYETKERRHAIETFVRDIPLEDGHPTAPVLDGVAAGCALLQNVPTLLLWGAKDLVFSDLYLHDLEARLPHAEVHRWPHAGHFVTEDADVAGAVTAWLSQLDAQKAVVAAHKSAVDDASESTRLLEHIDDPDRASSTAIQEMTGDERSITFGELSSRVDTTARGLATTGVEPGDRVAVMIPPGIDLAVTVYACWRLGAVAVLVDGALSPKQMGAALSAANPRYLIGIPKALAAAFALRWPGIRISAEPLSKLQRRLLGVDFDLLEVEKSAHPSLARLPHPDDEAGVVFTSGSTGPSKGVRYTHRQIAAQRDAIAGVYSITANDSLVAAFAPFALYGPMLGITSVVPDMDVSAPGSIDSINLARAVTAVDATMVFASPAALESLIRTNDDIVDDAHRHALAGVRLLLSAGAPVRTSLLSAAKAVFPNAVAHTPYGMTEVLPVASVSLPELESAGSGNGVCVGKPLSGVEVQLQPLVDELAEPKNGLGEIVVRAPHQRLKYDRLWLTTHRASQPAGWHMTGDVGHLDDQDRLWVGGRVGHVLWTADGPLAPVGLEKAVESIDGVYSAAVVGVGPRDNQQVVVVVQREQPDRKPALASLELIDAIREVAEPDVVAVFEVPALPVDRRHNSKIDRTAVAEWASTALAGGPLGKL